MDPYEHFSVQERTKIVGLYFAIKSPTPVQGQFRREFPRKKIPHRHVITRLIKKFRNTRGVVNNNKGHCGPKFTARTPAHVQDARDQLQQSPRKSTRWLSVQVGISCRFVRQIVYDDLKLMDDLALVTWFRNIVPQSLFSPALKNAYMAPSWYHMKLTGLFYKPPENQKETFIENSNEVRSPLAAIQTMAVAKATIEARKLLGTSEVGADLIENVTEEFSERSDRDRSDKLEEQQRKIVELRTRIDELVTKLPSDDRVHETLKKYLENRQLKPLLKERKEKGQQLHLLHNLTEALMIGSNYDLLNDKLWMNEIRPMYHSNNDVDLLDQFE